MMDINSILESLNSAQREAVSSDNKHTLVLAGAGSGKTRVLVHRIAWLIHVKKLMPSQIMAVTFTNKAAAEMKSRIEKMNMHQADAMWVGTFHSISHRILRKYHEAIGLAAHFTILNSDDMLRVIKKNLQILNIDESRFNPKMLQNFISQAKENRVAAHDLPDTNLYQIELKRIFQQYHDHCKQNHLLDFTDLLLHAINLLTQHPEIRNDIHKRIQAVLIDEFQDVNALQYCWLEAFYHEDLSSLCVGDDDQSIYSWRGARSDLMMCYQTQYSNVLTIRLEQNYRSTPIILEAANSLIAHNVNRLGKVLWTEEDTGNLITIFRAYNDQEEARYVIENIQDLINKQHNANSIAVLYRANAQSRLFEEQCHASGIAYKIHAGQRFFDRQEIKDALAYFRIAYYQDDTAALERIINTPSRGIGHVTVSNLRDLGLQNNMNLWEAIVLRSQTNVTQKLTQTLLQFKTEILEMHELTTQLTGRALANALLDKSQLIAHIQRTDKEYESRCENLYELLEAIDQFCKQGENNLLLFIQHSALMNVEDTAIITDTVQLMTLHAAKGLEFETVFMVGMEEELLPHKASFGDKSNLEEERRLCYVGMTRACKNLILTYAESRRLYGQETYQRPSRFLQEIPSHCLSHVRPEFAASNSFKIASIDSSCTANSLHSSNNLKYNEGNHVKHERFGKGTILKIEGQNPHMRMQVNFTSVGSKWFLCDYVDLDILQ